MQIFIFLFCARMPAVKGFRIVNTEINANKLRLFFNQNKWRTGVIRLRIFCKRFSARALALYCTCLRDLTIRITFSRQR